MITHTIDQFILDHKSKQHKVKVANSKNLPKIFWNFENKNKKLNVTHLLKLLDKMCKYEMDLVSIVEDAEWTRFCPQTYGQMDGWTDQ